MVSFVLFVSRSVFKEEKEEKKKFKDCYILLDQNENTNKKKIEETEHIYLWLVKHITCDAVDLFSIK